MAGALLYKEPDRKGQRKLLSKPAATRNLSHLLGRDSEYLLYDLDLSATINEQIDARGIY